VQVGRARSRRPYGVKGSGESADQFVFIPMLALPQQALS
jgi:hypothetical protein